MPQPTAQQFPRIFVSYRRDDSAGHAGRLSDRLSDHFGKDQIFMDIDNIQPGQDFVQVIENAVSSCEILIAIIGRHWLSGAGETSRLLDNPNDFVRLEIASALNRNVLVIPVLVQRATMPKPQDLPDDLTRLSRLNAHEISDLRWQRDVDQLIGILDGLLTSRGAARHEAERLRKEAEEKRRAEAVEAERRQAKERQIREAEAENERRRLAKGKGKRTMFFAVLAFVLLAFFLAVGVTAVVWMQQTRERAQHSANQNAIESTEQADQPGVSTPTVPQNETAPVEQPGETSASPTTATPLPATGQPVTEEEQKKPEEEASQKEEVWHVVIIRTRLSAPVPYRILVDGSWQDYELPPGLQLTHESHTAMTVKFYDGSREQQFSVPTLMIVRHKPTETEKAAATPYYFQVTADGKITLYSN